MRNPNDMLPAKTSRNSPISVSHLASWVRRLVALATRPGADFLIHNGTLANIRDHGVAYHLAYRQRNVGPAPWFEKTLEAQRAYMHAQRLEQPLPTWRDRRVFLVIHWGQLLANARPGSKGSTGALAHDLLAMLVGLVEQYDIVLADLIHLFATRRSQQLPQYRKENPLDFGIRGDVEAARFHAHLTVLLKNKRFRGYVQQTMDAGLKYAITTPERVRLNACPSGVKHRKGVSCDACESTKWVRHGTSLYAVGKFNWTHRSPFTWEPADPGLYVPADASWNAEVRRIVDGLGVADGIHRTGNYVLVNFERLVEIAVAQCLPSPLLKLYESCDRRLSVAGFKAVTAFRQFVGDAATAYRPRPLEDVVLEAGWVFNPHTLDQPYEIYSVAGLMRKLPEGRRSLTSMLANRPAVRAGVAVRPRKTPAVSSLTYRDPRGDLHLIQVVQRQRQDRARRWHNFYTVPYAVPRDADTPEMRIHHVRQVDGSQFYDLSLIHRHGNEHFTAWLAAEDTQMDRTRFKQLRYEAAFPERFAAKQRGERDGVGQFLESEDEILTRFMLTRENKLKRLDAGQWFLLLGELPGRDRQGVLRRLDALGKRYCLEHGWTKYAASGLCLVRTVKRRMAWSSLYQRAKASRLQRISRNAGA